MAETRKLAAQPGALVKRVRSGDLTEEELQQIPAQQLYIAILDSSLDSCTHILADLSAEQYRLLLDFELWHGDRFNEELFWRWLSTINEEQDLEPLFQLANALDENLLKLLVARHVQVQSLEEPTDQPPGPQFITPDKGYTWIRITVTDPERLVLFARFLAYVFEQDAEFFYQLLNESFISTPSELEEEGYQAKLRRLADEGVPSSEFSFELHARLSLEKAVQKLASGAPVPPRTVPNSLAVLLYERRRNSILQNLLEELGASGETELIDRLERELSLLVNSACVLLDVDLSDMQEIRFVVEKLRGAVQIGFELLTDAVDTSPQTIVRRVGLIEVYQVGLGELQKSAEEMRKVLEAEENREQAFGSILEGLKRRIPELPSFFNQDGRTDIGEYHLRAGNKAFQSLAELRALQAAVLEHCI